MATVDDLLAAIKHVKDCAGNQAWLTGLTQQDVSDVATVYAASPRRLDELITKIRQQHPDLFDPTTGAMVFPAVRRPGDHPPSDRQEGDAADAIRSAEAALAQQNSATAQLDLQAITAILNAHLKTVEGKEALDRLQRDIESAVHSRTDLDTPAGARDFQRFLNSKLQEIRAVVAGTNLDDTSKSALMAALTALYNASKADQPDPAERGASPAVSAAAPSRSDGTEIPDTEMDPYLDSPLGSDPDVLPAGASGQAPAPMPPPFTPPIPTMSGIPSPGAMPGGGTMPGWSLPSGPPPTGLVSDTRDHRSPEDAGEAALSSDDPAAEDHPSPDDDDANGDEDAGKQPAIPESPPVGPTSVTLPNGETVTAASPQLAAAIEAAVGGTPIADAFRQQGITIPPPGTAVSDPIDPSQLAPGDIGMFTDRHALALGRSETLLNGQIQHISTVQGPSFLGWEHPPAPLTVTAPANTEPPTPTRPAAIAGTS